MIKKIKIHYLYLLGILVLLVYGWQNPENFEPAIKLAVLFIWMFMIVYFKFSGRISFWLSIFSLIPTIFLLILDVEVLAVQLGSFIYAFLLIGLIQKIFEIKKEESEIEN